MRAGIRERASAGRRDEALAYIDQAEEFYVAASVRMAANPLLLYYSFLNVAKALVAVELPTVSMERARHGLSEQMPPKGRELRDSEIKFVPTQKDPNVFRLLAQSLNLSPPKLNDVYRVMDLLPQVVVGHRMYRAAVRSSEGFMNIEDIRFMADYGNKRIWADLIVDPGRMNRYRVSGKSLKSTGDLGKLFREVRSPSDRERRFEMRSPVTYGSRPTDELDEVVEKLRPMVWRWLSAVDPHRKYYVCLARRSRMAQPLALYVLLFYLGSITRYRPHVFEAVLAEPLGAFVMEFIATAPDQLAYMLASHMVRREVIRTI